MNRIVFSLVGVVLLCMTSGIAQNSLWSGARPDGHAPISVMGEHCHKKDGIMFSYRFMSMSMEDNLSESHNITNEDIFQNYMVAPQKMQMNMHMLGMMYAPTNKITLMLMANYISNSMDLKTGMGMDFTTESAGFGDITIGGLIKILNKNRQSIHANLGISIPSGNIDQRDDTPMMENAQLAYPMQIGSGTIDPQFGGTYLGQSDRFSWGFQSIYKLRLGDNSEDYSLGNKINLAGWGAIKASDHLSFSASLSYIDIGKIDGVDADLNPMMMPLFNTNNSGREELDLGIGSNILIPKGKFNKLRFAVEVKFPISQNVNGLQMKNKLISTFGLQYAL